MLTALNRMHEFRVHVRGAINNGATVEEIRETLLQAMVYCGAPAGLESFREAQAVLDELAAPAAPSRRRPRPRSPRRPSAPPR